MNSCSYEKRVSKDWIDDLTSELGELRGWLKDIRNIDGALEETADALVDKHLDYGEDNLSAFGELGMLVRATDKVACLKNLIERQVRDENHEDAWRDLAGYAIQALILMKQQKSAEEQDFFEIRKNRLMRGFCPDCGEGVLLRRPQGNFLAVTLYCSETCGFNAQVDLFEMENGLAEVIQRLAGRQAVIAQK